MTTRRVENLTLRWLVARLSSQLYWNTYFVLLAEVEA